MPSRLFSRIDGCVPLELTPAAVDEIPMVHKVGTRSFFSRKHVRFLLATALLAIPGISTWELLVSPHVKHLLALFLAFELLAVAVLVTEHFALSKSLSETKIAHDRLQMAITSGKTCGWEWDLATGRNNWFGDLRTIFGIQSDNWSGRVKEFLRDIHPEDRPLVSQAVAAARKDRTPFKAEFRVLHEDGSVRWISATGSFYYAKHGKAERMLGSAVDITERKQVEEELAKSEEKFAKAFRGSPLAVTLTSAVDHRYLDVNTTFEQITGWKREEVVGRTPLDVGVWVEPAEGMRFVEMLKPDAPVRDWEVRFRCRDGSERIGLGSGDLITIAGELCVVSVITDITERKRIEKQMHENEARFRGIVDSAMDAIIAVDEEQKVILFNAAAEKMYRCSASQAIGSPLSRFIPAPVRPEHEQHVRSFGESPISNRGISKAGILHGVRANGEKFPIEASISQTNIDGTKLFTAIIRDMSERDQTEQALRTSTERLRLAMQAGRMYVDEWEMSSNRVMRSAEVAEVLGKDQPLQTTAAQVLKQVHPDDRHTLEHFFEPMTPEYPITQINYRVLRPDSTLIWLEKSARGLFDESGKLMRTISVVADVTERKRSEEALRVSEERFRRVVEHINDALIIDNVAGQIIFANDRFLQLFGLTREQLNDLKIEDYVAPEYCIELRDRHDRRMRGESVSAHFEYEGIHIDGKRMWLEVDVVPIIGKNGNIEGTQSAIRDITERKRAAQSLLESEQRFRFVANSAPVMIWIAGTDKLCSYVNQQWLDFTGRSLDAELGTGWSDNIHPEDLSACLDTYSQAFNNREIFDMQYRVRRHDGQYRWIYDRGAPRLNADGSFAGYIGSCYDITERKLAQETLETLGRRLIEAHEQERTWIARELHDDICQRLALLTIELGRWSQQVPESAVDTSIRFEQARKGLFDISKDVQALSHRLHSSKLEYLGLTTGAKSFCREFSELHKVGVEFNHSDIPTDLSADVSLALFRVMQEALQNALKHSHVNRFEVTLRGEGADIILTVSDRGIGFAQREATTGRGLGLISMRERLQLVNGTLVVESKSGQGTTIRARVPIQAAGDSKLSAAG
jgi:PAS domain S-box-containing protein